MRLLCVVNPRSGGGRGAHIAEALKRSRVLDPDCLRVLTLQKDVSLPKTQEIEAEFTDVLIAGGDGTFSSVLTQFAGSKLRFHLLPLGTGNDLVREVGMLSHWKGSVDDYLKFTLGGACRELCLWKLSYKGEKSWEQKFVNYCSFGWDARVLQDFEYRRAKRQAVSTGGPWGNRFLYLLSAILRPKHPMAKYFLWANGHETSFESGTRGLIFANIQALLGLGHSNFESDFSDRRLECLPIRSFLDYLFLLLPQSLRNCRVKQPLIQAGEYRLRFAPGSALMSVQCDGEIIGEVGGGELSIVPDAMILLRCESSTSLPKSPR